MMKYIFMLIFCLSLFQLKADEPLNSEIPQNGRYQISMGMNEYGEKAVLLDTQTGRMWWTNNISHAGWYKLPAPADL